MVLREAQAITALILLQYLNAHTELATKDQHHLKNSRVSLTNEQGRFIYEYLNFFNEIQMVERIDRETGELQVSAEWTKTIRVLINNFLKLKH
jgi:hypothetical protein